MQLLNVLVAGRAFMLLGSSQHVYSTGAYIYYRGRGDADLRRNQRALQIVCRDRRDTPRCEPGTPQRRGVAGCLAVKRVDAVMLGGHDNEIMRAFARNVDSRQP